MKSSSELLVGKMMLLYENIYNLLDGFQKASTTNYNEVEVELKNNDGTSSKVKINSFQALQSELTRIDSNFKALTNSDNLSYIINADGSMSQVTKTTQLNAEYLTNIKISESTIVDTKSIVNSLIFPLVKIPITLNTKLKTNVIAHIFDVTSGYESIKPNSKLVDIQYLISNGDIIATEYKEELVQEKEKVTYFGKFNITSINSYSDNIYSINLSDIKYTDIYNKENYIDLKVNDILVSDTGNSKFLILSIDKFNGLTKLQRISGSDNLSVGIDKLVFNQKINTENNVVGLPIKPNKKLCIFLSVVNNNCVGYPSDCLLIDTSTYKVTKDNIIYSLDEYFSKYVTNFSEYITSLINETSIPFSLGIKPNKPILNNSNFKVIQINKHITDESIDKLISDLNINKEKIKNDIQYRETEINQIQKEIDTIKYKSNSEKEYRINKIKTYRDEIAVLNNNLLTVTRKIDTNATEYGLKNFKPKYKCIGFWEIQEPIYSPLTKPQNIIKYEVQYRYLSKNIDTVDVTSMKMLSNGKNIDIAFSSWNILQTKSLVKTLTDGKVDWEQTILESIDEININQCMIPINAGESLEIRVKAISEAGYPISPMSSDWSDIIRIDFPANISDSNVVTIVATNEKDYRMSEFKSILQVNGVFDHLNDTIKESEKTFLHSAKSIASGFFTEEQKNIGLDVYLQTLTKEIENLKTKEKNSNLNIELIDFNQDVYIIKNNSTLDINAGYYNDLINLLDTKTFGSVIRKKAFIRIKNNNQVPVELKTLVPGVLFNNSVAPNYHNVPVIVDDSYLQKSKQIIYFRNVDITGQQEDIFKLVKPALPDTTTNIDPTYIDNNETIEENKNIVYFDGSTVKTCKLKSEALTNFIALTKEHPLFTMENTEAIKPEFERIKKFTSVLKTPIYQTEVNQNTDNYGFKDNDIYLIGENSCGAYLYPVISNSNNICVVGNTTVSTLIVSANSEILIPIIFEYRMTDRLGKIDGRNNISINDELTYTKKIGVDLLLNGEIFKFDINCTSKLKSKIENINPSNVTTVISSYDKGQSKEIIS